jgi:hypothetical protein
MLALCVWHRFMIGWQKGRHQYAFLHGVFLCVFTGALNDDGLTMFGSHVHVQAGAG